MTTVTPPSGDASQYDILGAGDCNKALPVNTIERQISFGRFITLSGTSIPSLNAASGTVRNVVLPLHFINPKAAASAANGDPGQAPIRELDALKVKAMQRPPVVHIDNVAALIATKEIKSAKVSGEIGLSSAAISQLAYGGSAIVPLLGSKDHSSVRLEARGAKDLLPVPLANSHIVLDVAAFLARPAVQAVDGSTVPVKLDASHVADLLNRRSTQVKVQGQSLTLTHPSATETGSEQRGTLLVGDTGRSDAGPARATAKHETTSTVPASSLPFHSSAVPTHVAIKSSNPISSQLSPVKPPQLGFYIPYLQTWTILGYSRGALINTISLAPQEETTIELFTWDRHTSASEQTSSSEIEQNIESTDNTKDTTQVANELTKDSNFKADAHVHANVTLAVATIGGDAGVNYGNDAKNVASRTTDFIHESTQKATLRVRASRQNKVSETQEYGSEQRTTRKLKNPNMCHALNLDYFEILVNYKVETVCVRQDAQLVVLLDFPEKYNWTRRNIRRFEPILKSVLIDRSYVGGFDASRLLAARDEAFTAVCEKCVCADEGSQGTTIDPALLEEMQDAAFMILGIVAALAALDTTNIPELALEVAAPPDPSSSGDPDPTGLANNINRWLFLEVIQAKAGGVWTGLLSLANVGLPAQAADISIQTLHAIHSIINSSTAPIGDVMTLDDPDKQTLRATLHGIALWVYKDFKGSDLQGLQVAITVSLGLLAGPIEAGIASLINSALGSTAQSAITEVAAEVAVAAVDARYGLDKLDDMGIVGQIAAFSDAYTDWQNANADLLKQAQATAQALDTLANTRNDDIKSAYPLSTVADAREREEALTMHLTDYNNFYTFSIYMALLTSGAGRTPYLVQTSNGLISANPIGVVNGKLAFPVNLDDAIAADPSTLSALATWFDTLIRDNTDLDDGPAPSVMSLPTPAITLETRLGTCDACEEFIEESRHADLRKRRAEAKRMEQEAHRLELRLQQNPPDLRDPEPRRHEPAFTLKVIQEPSASSPTAPSTPTPSTPTA
jgi:hypothetical protein